MGRAVSDVEGNRTKAWRQDQKEGENEAGEREMNGPQ